MTDWKDFDDLPPHPRAREQVALLGAVTDRLYFGAAPASPRHLHYLRSLGITHILDLSGESTYPCPPEMTRLECFTPDDGWQKGTGWFGPGIAFVVDALDENQWNRVYIHCFAGISRSSSMTFAVLLALGYTPSDAETMLRRARDCHLTYKTDAIIACQELGWTDWVYDPGVWFDFDLEEEGENDPWPEQNQSENRTGWRFSPRRTVRSSRTILGRLRKSVRPTGGKTIS